MEKLCYKVLGLWLWLYDRHFLELMERKKPKSISWFLVIIIFFEGCSPPPHALYNKYTVVAMKTQFECYASASEMLNFPVHF